MLKNLLNNKGNIAVLVAGSMIVLLGFTALAVDIGIMVNRKAELQKACDAAALAGAQELPDDVTSADTIAKQYAADNGLTAPTVTITDSNKKITVSASEQVDFFFARALGIDNGNVSVSATAVVAAGTVVEEGLRPFGVSDETYEEGQRVVLKEGVPNGEEGNFMALSFDPPEGETANEGTDYYRDMIEFGSERPYAVGDDVDTKPGEMGNTTVKEINDLIKKCTDNHDPDCKYDNYVEGCPRVITVPIIDEIDTGRDEVEILGFAIFFLEKIEEVNEEIIIDGKKTKVGHIEIQGTFLGLVGSEGSDPSLPDFGYRGVKLVD